MGFLKKMQDEWKSKDVTEKLAFVFDIIASIGGGLIGTDLGKRFGEGHHPITRICIQITTAGIGMATGDLASKKLREGYAEPIGKIVDVVKGKMNEEEKEDEHKYTRY